MAFFILLGEGRLIDFLLGLAGKPGGQDSAGPMKTEETFTHPDEEHAS
jgi:hypothetical protein